MNTNKKPLWLILAPVAFTILWAGGYGIAKVGLQYAEPMTLLSMRFSTVVILLFPFFLIFRPALPKHPKEWGHLVVVGVLVQAVYFGFCWWAFRSGVSAGVLAIFMSLQPILVAILAPKLAQEKVSWLRWLGLLLGLTGVFIVIIARSDIEPPTLIGVSFSVMGLLGITSGVLYEKRFGGGHHPIVANMVQYAAGFAVVAPIALIFETMEVTWTMEFFAALAYLAIGNSILAISLLLAMIRAGEVSRVSSLMFLVPPLAALFGWVLLGEEMPLFAWVGMAVAAIGVLIVSKNKTV
ncbi:multidrug DMT transporter permease [Kiloniella litopenaei]|uniref:Multidrug DMT transporter permease n=1 Tax=Kiloniella litopenaei TaxID=1549748 RepID=A0A0M2RE28_9PROT|nr:DMT family transporter [Kiloniella litopenaei]KKJ78255.1 multidrug DMT transporter permease [Kiloniella litopenaei]